MIYGCSKWHLDLPLNHAQSTIAQLLIKTRSMSNTRKKKIGVLILLLAMTAQVLAAPNFPCNTAAAGAMDMQMMPAASSEHAAAQVTTKPCCVVADQCDMNFCGAQLAVIATMELIVIDGSLVIQPVASVSTASFLEEPLYRPPMKT